jgi:hypothetical protein
VKNPDAYNYVTPNAVQPTWKSKAAASAARTLQPPTISTSGKATANTRAGTGAPAGGMGAPGTGGMLTGDLGRASPSIDGVPLNSTI